MRSTAEGSVRPVPALRRRARLLLGAVALTAFVAGEAQAQELVHRFLNPSFGGNPFNSEHLLSIANIDRPEEPEEEDETPSEEELLARQLRARYNARLISEIQDRIDDAKPGESGEFTLGDQRVSFTRTATETRITFVNTRTGETQVVVVPVDVAEAALAASGTSSVRGQGSAEQILSLTGSRSGPLSDSMAAKLLGAE